MNGQIVAATFIGLLVADSGSYVSLDRLFEPNNKLKDTGVFGLRQMIKYALELKWTR